MTAPKMAGLAHLASAPDDGMLNLLGQVNAMSSSRDREQMTLRLVSAMRDVLGAVGVVLYAVSASAHGPVGALVAEASPGDAAVCGEDDEYPAVLLRADPFLAEAIRAPLGSLESHTDGTYRLALAMGERGNPHALLIATCHEAPDPKVREAFTYVAHFYQNQLDLLDYAELDTLTHLLNRKTFDENFDRFIASTGRSLQREEGERRAENAANYHSWLAVIDIDHFKRINDNFGHLFGDEVLLRLSDLMRKSFRLRDKLFRFGGEEFIVLLRHVSDTDARLIFDRFRATVEEYDFPQVGRVTASLGYSRIDTSKPAAEILGHADEALYFSKENGRNQVNGFENLLERGLLESHQKNDNTDLQADIDALFD